jgi:hypothetical protein
MAMIRKISFASLLLCMSLLIHAQTIITNDSDTTIMTEYNDGRLWAYQQSGDFVVGMTNYEEKDDYGKYYQIVIFIKNLGEKPVTFDPEYVESYLNKKDGKMIPLDIYTYEDYMRKVKNSQAWAMALYGFSTGLNAGMAGYQTTYTTTYGAGKMPYTQVHTTYNYAAASAANMAATNQIMTLSKLMADERNTKSKGYLKKTTIHPGEGIIGYMNIKRKKGCTMKVLIPVEKNRYMFEWDVLHKRYE